MFSVYKFITLLIWGISLSQIWSTNRTHRTTTIDVTMDDTAQDVDLREACHRTGSTTIARCWNLIGIRCVIIVLQRRSILCDTRTTTIDITTVQPLWAIEVIGL